MQITNKQLPTIASHDQHSLPKTSNWPFVVAIVVVAVVEIVIQKKREKNGEEYNKKTYQRKKKKPVPSCIGSTTTNQPTNQTHTQTHTQIHIPLVGIHHIQTDAIDQCTVHGRHHKS